MRRKGRACKWVIVRRTGESVEGKFRTRPGLVGVEGTFFKKKNTEAEYVASGNKGKDNPTSQT